MAANGDQDELARRFLDLWQTQVTALAEDPEFAALMQRWIALWMAGSWNESVAPGPPTAAAPSRTGASDLDDLTCRIRDIERRLDALERNSGAGN